MNNQDTQTNNKNLKQFYDFTFVTLTFNQDTLIKQHLDSILFLRNSCLKDKFIELIITDDCSSDFTVDIINQWVDLNEKYFDNLIFISNKSNLGTAKSFVNATMEASGEFVKFLAGDDVYLKNDMSEILSVLHENDIVFTPLYYFNGLDINSSLEKQSRKALYAINHFVSTFNKKGSTSFLSAPASPGLFIRRDVLTADVLNFIRQFDLIEDKPMWIKIFETNSSIRIAAFNKAYVGYRQHVDSVSKGRKNKKVHSRYKIDQYKLNVYQYKTAKSILDKAKHLYYIWYDQFDFPFKKYLNLNAVIFNLKFLLNNIRLRKFSRREKC